MKKGAIIMSSIVFGIVVSILFVCAISLIGLSKAYDEYLVVRNGYYQYETKVVYDKTTLGIGVFLIIFSIIYLIFGLLLLIYTGRYVAAYNQVKLGILILLFICVPGGIMIICLPRGTFSNNYNNNQKTNTISTQPSAFSQLVEQNNQRREYLKRATDQCALCRKRITKDDRYIVSLDGKTIKICKECFVLEKSRGKRINIIK